MIGGTFLLTCHDAISKWMTGSYSVGEVMFYRSAFPVFLLGAILLRDDGVRSLLPKFPVANFTRAGLAAVTSCLVVASYAVLPLADALAIIFASPIFLTALSVPLLREQVGWRRWAAVLVGFLGVVIMVDPAGDVFRFGALIAVGAALASALRDVVTRRLGTGDSTTNILFYTTIATGLFGLTTVPFLNHGVPSWADCGLFFIAGLLVTAAHWLIIKSFQLAQASAVAPLRYLAIVYAAVLGFLVFDEIPGATQVTGAVVVVAAALYIVHRERMQTKTAVGADRA
ncbi:MAG: DMT family transporter [Chromatiales bacterium]|jgi:drug/metabolite transporter (DMT)-like permease|nr:DMT family transporter [Chromatiales bacterium]